MNFTASDKERFFVKVNFEPTSGCWLWGGSASHGYGTFWHEGKMLLAHRVSMILHNREIQPGTELDHLCRNISCVNPGHLEAVTHRENVRRGVGISAVNARKDYCKAGHPFNAENTEPVGNGNRKCKQCQRDAQRRRYNSDTALRERMRAYSKMRRDKIRATLLAEKTP